MPRGVIRNNNRDGSGGYDAPSLMEWDFPTATFGPFDDGWFEADGFVADPLGQRGTVCRKTFTYGSEQGSALAYLFSVDEDPWATSAEPRLFVRWWAMMEDTGGANGWTNGVDSGTAGALKWMRIHGPSYRPIIGSLGIQFDYYQWDFGGLDPLDQYRRITGGADVRPSDHVGAWHCSEVEADLRVSGALTMRLWIDDALKMEHVVNAVNTFAGDPFGGAAAQYGSVIFHGNFNSPAVNGRLYSDGYAVSTSRIGMG
jgi:hypothetical protein